MVHEAEKSAVGNVEKSEDANLKSMQEAQSAGKRRIQGAVDEVRKLDPDQLLTLKQSAPELTDNRSINPLEWVGQGIPRQVNDGPPVNIDPKLSQEQPVIPPVVSAPQLVIPDYAAIAEGTDSAPASKPLQPRGAGAKGVGMTAAPNPTVEPEAGRSDREESLDAEQSGGMDDAESGNAKPAQPESESITGKISPAEQQQALSGAQADLQGKNPSAMKEVDLQKLMGQTMLRHGVNVSVENGQFRIEAPQTSMDKMINILMGAVSYFTAIANELGERMGKNKKSETPIASSNTSSNPSSAPSSSEEGPPSQPTTSESPSEEKQPRNSVEKQVLKQIAALSDEGMIYKNGEFLMSLDGTTLHIRYNEQDQKWQMRTGEQSEWTSDFTLQQLAPTQSPASGIPVIGNAFVGSQVISMAKNMKQSFDTLQKVAHFNAVLDAIKSESGDANTDATAVA